MMNGAKVKILCATTVRKNEAANTVKAHHHQTINEKECIEVQSNDMQLVRRLNSSKTDWTSLLFSSK